MAVQVRLSQRYLKDFEGKCGIALGLLKMTAKFFIHELVTSIDGGWGTGEPHTEIEFPKHGNEHYHKRVKDIYDNSMDCCDLLQKMRILIRDAWMDEFFREGNYGPVDMPKLHPYFPKNKPPTSPTNDFFDRTIGDICRMRDCRPVVRIIPLPVVVPNSGGNTGQNEGQPTGNQPGIGTKEVLEVGAVAACTGVAVKACEFLKDFGWRAADAGCKCLSVFGMFDPGGRYRDPTFPGGA